MTFDVVKVRNQFPQIQSTAYDRPLVYLDSAATALKPQSVIEVMDRFYLRETANIHRGAHYFGNLGTQNYEDVRKTVMTFLGARAETEIVFTKGTTDGLNLIAHSFGRSELKPGDEILLTQVEHHSNIVPWQMLAKEKDLKIRVLPVLDSGQWDIEVLGQFLGPQTRLVAMSHVSNVTGLVHPVDRVIRRAREVGAITVIDAAQSVTDLAVDVQSMGCDFLVFSAHKLFGPFGVGILYGREELLAKMPPYQGGGSMISNVTFEETTFLPTPHRFEAGTPNIAGVLALKPAIDFVLSLGFEGIHQHKLSLLNAFEQRLRDETDAKIFGEGDEKSGICSFLIPHLHPGDLGALLDRSGVAIRTGHLCAQPLMNRFGVQGLMRVSFSIYNDASDIDSFFAALHKARELLQ